MKKLIFSVVFLLEMLFLSMIFTILLFCFEFAIAVAIHCFIVVCLLCSKYESEDNGHYKRFKIFNKTIYCKSGKFKCLFGCLVWESKK